MSIATLTNTNQMIIPKDILMFLGLKTGEQLDFVVEKGRVVLHPVTLDVRDLKGILKRETNKTVSIEDMNVAIVRGAIGPVQSVQANQLIEQTLTEGKSLFINHIVLCELVWVLTRAYDYPKSDVVEVIEKILLARQFEIEDKNSVQQALNDFKTSRADFADCLIGVKNSDSGCEKTWSFDKATSSLDTFTFLEKAHLPKSPKGTKDK